MAYISLQITPISDKRITWGSMTVKELILSVEFNGYIINASDMILLGRFKIIQKIKNHVWVRIFNKMIIVKTNGLYKNRTKHLS